MRPSRRRLGLLLGCAALLFCLPVAAQEHGDKLYQPSVGQRGKDVIWVPTPNEMVTAMLATAGVGPNDLVYDLGAGDGKIAIAAAREFGARAVGIEFDGQMAALAQRNAERAGVGSRVKVIQGDIFKEDFSSATVVTMYLLPELNLRLEPILKKMRPGTRVVSHSFDMETWEPDERIETSSALGYLWIVPAQAAGVWTVDLPFGQGPAELTLTQIHQRVQGNIRFGGRTMPISTGRIRGSEIHFAYVQPNGQPALVTAKIEDDRMSGEVAGVGGELRRFDARLRAAKR
ncbi:MAG: class I SAM-dependent methyltransferase [Betaproteobacteria bacterium]|nr:class I SAM-dependent methyltransferase [Betaproteobacteria bacterium]NCA17066.1 class I SAM-dependent methyltransferase [Betaproteobacteria bacterium]